MAIRASIKFVGVSICSERGVHKESVSPDDT